MYGYPVPYSCVRSYHYDMSGFINKFMKRISSDTFDGINKNSTVEDIVNNSIYKDCINFYNDNFIVCRKDQKITDDIGIQMTFFYFTEPIYKLINDNSSNKQEKEIYLSEKISGMIYEFYLLNNARNKGALIAKELKEEIENRFNITFKVENFEYIALQDDEKPSFIIEYDNYGVELHIGFRKDVTEGLLGAKLMRF